MKKLIDIIEEEKIEKETVSTGFKQLDMFTQGFRKSNLIYIGARVGMGKTTFAVNLAEHIAGTGKKCVFFSLEYYAEHLAEKFSNINSDSEIYIEDKSIITVSEMKQKVKDLKNVDCVIIDYFGLISPEIRKTDRMQEIYDISKDLKRMAKELDIPVVCIQYIRKGYHKPSLTDIHRNLSHDSDMVMFLYRENWTYDSWTYDTFFTTNSNITNLIIAKNRYGDTGMIDLKYDSDAKQFTEVDTL